MSLPASALAAEGSDVSLSVEPNLCVLSAEETECRDRVAVHWKAPRERSLCLYRQGQAEPLTCWRDSRAGRYVSQLTAGGNTRFQLRPDAGGPVIASRVFEVVRDAPRYRRRRRNPWSFL